MSKENNLFELGKIFFNSSQQKVADTTYNAKLTFFRALYGV